MWIQAFVENLGFSCAANVVAGCLRIRILTGLPHCPATTCRAAALVGALSKGRTPE
jgi:hypothetical protein